MSSVCNQLHGLFHDMQRFQFPFDQEKIPINGIYILFEKGEVAHTGDRVVRVGTHTGNNQLRSRLKQHFLTENKDRSIFRKNIGRAYLNKHNDPFLEKWNWDLTSRMAKDQLGHLVDVNKKIAVEKIITKYIQQNFSFVVFEVTDKKQRMDLETKIISTVSWCSDCKPSLRWFGLSSPKEKIQESGLWLVNGLYKTELTKIEFGNLDARLRNANRIL